MEVVIKEEEAEADADAERAKEATRPIGKAPNTKPAVRIRVAPYMKIVTIRGETVAKIRTAQIIDRQTMEEVEAVEAVAVVTAVEDTTTTVGTITKGTISQSHDETDTIMAETKRETIIRSKRQEELSVKRGRDYLHIQIIITTTMGITTTKTNATDRNVRASHSQSVKGVSQDRSQMRG